MYKYFLYIIIISNDLFFQLLNMMGRNKTIPPSIISTLSDY